MQNIFITCTFITCIFYNIVSNTPVSFQPSEIKEDVVEKQEDKEKSIDEEETIEKSEEIQVSDKVEDTNERPEPSTTGTVYSVIRYTLIYKHSDLVCGNCSNFSSHSQFNLILFCEI